MRQCFNVGNMTEADRILAVMDESNHQSILDLQNEIADGSNMLDIIGSLSLVLKREIREGSRGRSPGPASIYS